MDNDKIQETRTPQSWMDDYWSEWDSQRLQISLMKNTGEPDVTKLESIRTFHEYVREKEYDGQRCDLATIPEYFIHQTSRLVRIYNSLISQENANLDKLVKVIDIADKVRSRN